MLEAAATPGTGRFPSDPESPVLAEEKHPQPLQRSRCCCTSVPGAKPAPGLCFERVNSAGDPYGNCGKDAKSSFAKCEMRYGGARPAALGPLPSIPSSGTVFLVLAGMLNAGKSSVKEVPAGPSSVPMPFP